MKNYFCIFIAVIILLLIYMRIEAGLVEIKRVEFTKSKKCLKLLHISDIHIGLLRVPVKKIKNIIENEEPDIIIMTGDYIERPAQVPEFIQFLECVKGSFRVFLCFGNHDYKAFNKDKNKVAGFIRAIERTGAQVLHNRSVCVEFHNKKYNIIGIEDNNAGKPDIESALGKNPGDIHMNIAFSHNPDIVLKIPRNKVDYLFCGHFHGGQIWTPFGLEFKILRRDELCKMGIRKGLHKINGINLYINRGLGNVIFPLRFFSRPEIAVYYLP